MARSRRSNSKSVRAHSTFASGICLAVVLLSAGPVAAQFDCSTPDTLEVDPQKDENSPYPHNLQQVVLRIAVHKGLSVPPNPTRDWSDAEIDATLEKLVEDFASHGIFFRVVGRDEEDIFYYPDIDQIVPVRGTNGTYDLPLLYFGAAGDGVEDVLDLWFLDRDFAHPVSCLENVNGMAAGIGARACLVRGAAGIGTSVLSHEVEHCLGLYHTHGNAKATTFVGNCQSETQALCIIPANNRDGVCDTPPDPNLRAFCVYGTQIGDCTWCGLISDACQYSVSTAQLDSVPALADCYANPPEPANIMA